MMGTLALSLSVVAALLIIPWLVVRDWYEVAAMVLLSASFFFQYLHFITQAQP